MGNALGGGSGWVLLTYVPRDGRLINQYASDHSQAVASGVPILALDMYEHAYHMDFGANAARLRRYVLRNIDWKAWKSRYEDARRSRRRGPGAAGVRRPARRQRGGGEGMLEAGKPVQVIDARPRHSVTRTQDIIDGAPGATRSGSRNGIGELSKSEPVVVFCVYGFHIGCQTAIALREAGFDAKYMKGGHSAWKAIGAPPSFPILEHGLRSTGRARASAFGMGGRRHRARHPGLGGAPDPGRRAGPTSCSRWVLAPSWMRSEDVRSRTASSR